MYQRSLLALVFTSFILMANPAHAVFIGDSSGNIYDLDVTTNTSTLIGNSGVGAMFDIALDPTTSILYGITGTNNFYSINTTNGAAAFIGSSGAFINGLTFDSSGTLYGSGSTSLFTINLGSGTASTVGSTGFNSSGDLAFDSSGNLFMSAAGGTPTLGNDLLVSLSTATGAGSLIGNIGFGNVFGLNFLDPTMYGFTLDGRTLTIDTSTGAGTQIAVNSISTTGADGAGGVAAVPEPTTLALLSLGFAGLGFARRKMKA